MKSFKRAAFAGALLCSSWPDLATAEELQLTLDAAIEIARVRAPDVVSARGRIDEARGRLAGASVLLRQNTNLDLAAGRRYAYDGSETAEADILLTQVFETGGQRGARIAGAQASIAGSEAAHDDVTRRLVHAVAVTFTRVLHADERLRIARNTETLAVEVVRITERRFAAGDIPKLELNIAQAALSRSRADVNAADASRDAIVGELRLLLGLDAETSVDARGDLAARPHYDVAALLQSAVDRPETRLLAAENDEARADLELGEATRWPDVGVSAHYQRHERADLMLGGLSFTLPFFDNGQGRRAEASARARRLTFELDANRRRIAVEVQTAFDVYRRRIDALVELEQNALPLLDSNEALAKRSYESGQLGLADFFVVRRELLGTRIDYLDRLLEAAVARIDLQSRSGLLR